MAGAPDKRRRLALIESMRAEIMEWLEGGESLQRIALRLSDKLEETISYALVGRWCQEPQNAQQVSDARARAADHRAERIGDRSDELVRDVALGLKGRDDIAAARVANDADQWIAGVWNRAKYGQQNGASVTLNIGQLHMAALRQEPASAALRPPELQAFDVEDVEYVEHKPLTLDDLL